MKNREVKLKVDSFTDCNYFKFIGLWLRNKNVVAFRGFNSVALMCKKIFLYKTCFAHYKWVYKINTERRLHFFPFLYYRKKKGKGCWKKCLKGKSYLFTLANLWYVSWSSILNQSALYLLFFRISSFKSPVLCYHTYRKTSSKNERLFALPLFRMVFSWFYKRGTQDEM